MPISEQQFDALVAQVAALTQAVGQIADVLVQQQQEARAVAFAEENERVSQYIREMLDALEGDVNFGDADELVTIVEAAYQSDAKDQIDVARAKLREIYMASSKAWRNAAREGERPSKGIAVNPDCHVYRLLKGLLIVLAADRANAIHGVGGGWTSLHVDRRLSNFVENVAPEIIAEAEERHHPVLNSWLAAAAAIIEMAE
jgi:hypothetical protein